MKKKLAIVLIALNTSCALNENVIFCTNQNVKKSIHNIEQLELWIYNDLENGEISRETADDYLIALTHTRLSLKKKCKNDK